MPYTIKKTGVYDGRKLAAGATIGDDELRPTVLVACLRTGMVAQCGEEIPADDDADADLPAGDDDAGGEAGSAAPEPEEPSDAPDDGESLATLGIDGRFVAVLEAAGLTNIDACLDYLDEHGTFAGLDGIGKKTDETIRAALAAQVGE